MDHFPLAHLPFKVELRVRKHLAKTLQATGKGRWRHFEEELGIAFTGTGIHLAAVVLHVAHQAVFQRETLIAKKEQMFEKVRQPRPCPWRVMAAGLYPHCRCAAF
ncbi:hypothetical protein D9M71_351040 [compost metagenome]